jgi:hypothetical protein
LHPGASVEFSLDEDRVVVRKVSADIRSLGGRFAGSDMAAKLLEDRAREPR